jgi:hypothetical protein
LKSHSGGYEEHYLLEITPCSSLKFNLSFGRICCFHFQNRRISQARNLLVATLLSPRYLARLIRPWTWRRYVPPKRRLTLNGLHGAMSQKIVLLVLQFIADSACHPVRKLFSGLLKCWMQQFDVSNLWSLTRDLKMRHPVFAPLWSTYLACNSAGWEPGWRLGYELDDRRVKVRFPEGAREFIFSIASRQAVGPTQPPVQRVPAALFLGIKRQGHEADHSPPFSAEVKNGGAVLPLPHTSSQRSAVMKEVINLC